MLRQKPYETDDRKPFSPQANTDVSDSRDVRRSDMPDPQLLSTLGVAQRLRVSPSAVKNWEAEGRIPPAFAKVLPGGRRVWRAEDIEAIANSEAARKRVRPQCEPAGAA
jgi:hypothetical protein